jgi:alpha-N-arabinofuranosidase
MAEASVDILLNEPIGTINPNIYGHFMEHLGGCIDEGCWVGEDSLIDNTNGVRNDVVAALKAIDAPNIRWPGGCFADDYHWQDGIGPRDKRPRRINIHWGNVIETNHFGTHEFLGFCRSVGAAPYFCGNLGSGSPREMRDWVEYCNFPGDSEWARQRAANGSPEPFNVRYWGVGNENWGCGGNFSPEDYGTEYRRYATYLRSWGATPLYLIACGPSSNDLDWTRRFFTKLKKDYWSGPSIHGYAAHYYCGTAGTATEYTEAQWYELLWKSIQMEPLVVQQRALMDAFDPERKIGLIVDEWGTWHPATPDRNPAFLWQQNTVRDALVAALTLDIFNRHADKVVMSNIAQTINVLQALLLTDGDKMLKTPTCHIYDLYKVHHGAQSARILIDSPEIDVETAGRKHKLATVAGSASVKDGKLNVTLVNTSATEPQEVNLRLFGGQATALTVTVLDHGAETGLDIYAHNTHDEPNRVTLRGDVTHEVTGDRHTHALRPASVTRLTFTL